MIGVSSDAKGALAVARDPKILEPADVAGFPQGRSQLRREGNVQRRAQTVFKGGQQVQGALPDRLQRRDHLWRPARSRGIGRGPSAECRHGFIVPRLLDAGGPIR
ncbi:MAG TPA: hypothetical protein PK752_21820 [Accumulibacter sp.]|nr:hypothetical protein [Accumulibacter sp.]